MSKIRAYRKQERLSKDERKARREARRQVKVALATREVDRHAQKAAAAAVVKEVDPKLAKHLAAQATRILHQDRERRWSGLRWAKPISSQEQARRDADRSRTLSKALVFRRGTMVHTYRWKEEDGKPPRRVLVNMAECASLNQAKRASGLGAVVLRGKEQFPQY